MHRMSSITFPAPLLFFSTSQFLCGIFFSHFLSVTFARLQEIPQKHQLAAAATNECEE